METVTALVTMLASLVVLLALAAAHLMRTDLSPVSDPVSAYALTRARVAYAIAAVAAAVAGGASAMLLSTRSGVGAAVVLLWIFAVARLVIPLIPMDRPGRPATTRGRLHNLLAIVAFASVTAAAFTAIAPLAAAGDTGLALGTRIAAIAMALGSVAVIAASAVPLLRRVFGLAERLIYLGFIAWFLGLALGTLAH